VRDLVDGEEEVLVRGSAEDVGDGPELPRPEGGVAQEVGEQQLEADDGGDDVLGQGLGAAQFGDLGVRLDDGHAPRPMRLLGVGPEEVAVAGVVDLRICSSCTVCVAVGRAIGGLPPLGSAIGRCCHRASHGEEKRRV
jgi:hypothetical protein